MRLFTYLAIAILPFISFAAEADKKEEKRETSSIRDTDRGDQLEYKKHLKIIDKFDRIR